MEDACNFVTADGATLAGILRVVPAAGKKLVLLCHAMLTHKNALFMPMLAEALPFHTYRYDLRGHGDSDGQPTYTRLEDDMKDLRCVHDGLTKQGYEVVGIVGHSRGGWLALKYVVQERPLSFVVNLASRYLMADGPKKHSAEEMAHLAEHGYFLWNYRRKGRPASFKVTQADIDAFSTVDMSHISRISPSTAVLTVHGLADQTVTTDNAAYLANLIPNHTLRLIRDADHFFTAQHEIVVKAIAEWLDSTLPESRRARLDRAHRSLALARFVQLQGVTNCRDLGGYPTIDGSVVRPRRIFRAGELSGATSSDIDLLASLGVHSLFDLRSNPECKDRGVVNLQGRTDVQRVFCPVFEDEDYSPEALAKRWLFYTQGPEGFCNAYMMILEKGGPAFRRVLEALASSGGGIVFHCTAGKDRTGVMAMLILMVLNVSDDIICWDYEQTHLVLKRDREQIDRIISMTGGKLTEEGALSMVSASYDSMALTIASFRQRWTSIDNYLDTIGVAPELRDTLRAKYLSRPSAL